MLRMQRPMLFSQKAKRSALDAGQQLLEAILFIILAHGTQSCRRERQAGHSWGVVCLEVVTPSTRNTLQVGKTHRLCKGKRIDTGRLMDARRFPTCWSRFLPAAQVFSVQILNRSWRRVISIVHSLRWGGAFVTEYTPWITIRTILIPTTAKRIEIKISP